LEYEEGIRVLIENGISPNASDEFGNTALHYAFNKGNENLCRLLINSGASTYGIDYIHRACINGWSKILPSLGYRDLNKFDKNGFSPLFYACIYGHEKCVKYLINCGCSLDDIVENKKDPIDHADIDGVTPLYLAAKHGHVKCLRHLLKAGADTSMNYDWYEGPNENNIPILIALENCNIECAYYLITEGKPIVWHHGNYKKELLSLIDYHLLGEEDNPSFIPTIIALNKLWGYKIYDINHRKKINQWKIWKKRSRLLNMRFVANYHRNVEDKKKIANGSFTIGGET
jgi:hypothetical protein